jgi:hypothetical protein
VILYDVLANYAGIEGYFINQAAWEEERAKVAGLDLNLSGLIPKPTDVDKIIKELADTVPFFAYWDEFTQLIELKMLKAPPSAANVFDMDGNLIKDSVKVTDKPDLRASTVYYTFGQVDPTKSLTDLNNYTQTIVRIDTDSVVKYQSDQIKKVVTRWIASTNKPLAENAAQLYGRRFSDIPREISFSVEAKDNAANIGENRSINHRDMVDATGSPVSTIFQIISRQESKNFNYKGLEYGFGDTITGDNDIDDNTIKISVDDYDVDLYARYVSVAGMPTGSTNAVFEVESGVVVGASTTSNYAIDTGSSWPSGATIKLINNGYIVGAGGAGGVIPYGVSTSGLGSDGGDAINLQEDIEIVNNGVIGGGGGGGDSFFNLVSPNTYMGGGGAGAVVGVGGGGESGGVFYQQGNDGTLESGGAESFRGYTDADGGDLGESPVLGCAAGNAINKNGNTLTYDSNSDVRGVVA